MFVLEVRRVQKLSALEASSSTARGLHVLKVVAIDFSWFVCIYRAKIHLF